MKQFVKKNMMRMSKKKFERENERRKNMGLKLLKKGEIPAESDNQKDDPVLDESGHILADYVSLIS